MEQLLAEPPAKRQRISDLDGAADGDEHPSSDSKVGPSISDVPKEQATETMAEEQLRKETNVGITMLTNPSNPGFQGILKKRYATCRSIFAD